ncbi:MAG TPA: carboxypeptidase-like regulatory domain-containing protein [Candidatus Hydrogenedentes bacterium]|nr:carboxypeptidase-like regulatory domain-containing protein [Candidatus Hydrogenedentota bacterium]
MTLCAVLATFAFGAAALTGQVVDAAGNPAAGARVFLEPGLEGELIEGRVAADGRFSFDDVAPGAVGVIAAAPGYGHAGRHFNLGLDDVVSPFTLRMAPAGRIAGRVLTEKGKPIAGARVTRVALLGDEKVGIPLTKLRTFGIAEPWSDADGRFAVEQLPEGGTVALKVNHPDYAQEGTTDVRVGDENVRVTLTPGVIAEGSVLTRHEQMAVANVEVVFQNAAPPHDTVIAHTDGRGRFQVRLKPGAYLARAAGGGYRSPGLIPVAISTDAPRQVVRLQAVRTGRIRGTVKDAVSGEPVRGVRVLLESSGNVAALVRTGATGEFDFEAAAGQNVVRIDAAPGYAPPAINTVSATVTEGQELTLPGFWLAPLPVEKGP